MIKHLLVTAVSLLSFCASLAAEGSMSVARLGWLAGTWQFAKDGRVVTEMWMAPEGKTMLGMGRTVVAGATREYEFLLVREEADRLSYVAKPSGQAEATFVLRTMTDVEVVFENPTHDFPQRISYQLRPDGTLLAAIEGTLKGKFKRVEYPYRRVQ
jgi:hypothetical protein